MAIKQKSDQWSQEELTAQSTHIQNRKTVLACVFQQYLLVSFNFFTELETKPSHFFHQILWNTHSFSHGKIVIIVHHRRHCSDEKGFKFKEILQNWDWPEGLVCVFLVLRQIFLHPDFSTCSQRAGGVLLQASCPLLYYFMCFSKWLWAIPQFSHTSAICATYYHPLRKQISCQQSVTIGKSCPLLTDTYLFHGRPSQSVIGRWTDEVFAVLLLSPLCWILLRHLHPEGGMSMRVPAPPPFWGLGGPGTLWDQSRCVGNEQSCGIWPIDHSCTGTSSSWSPEQKGHVHVWGNKCALVALGPNLTPNNISLWQHYHISKSGLLLQMLNRTTYKYWSICFVCYYVCVQNCAVAFGAVFEKMNIMHPSSLPPPPPPPPRILSPLHISFLRRWLCSYVVG